jgi:hypothetical protein
MEAAKLSDLYADAGAFEEPIKQNIRQAITEYTETIVQKEWPAMKTGERRDRETREMMREAYNKLWQVYLENSEKCIRKSPLMYEESMRQLNSMAEYRRLRRFGMRASTPLAIWIVLIGGGIIAVAYTLLFWSKHFWAQCAMTTAYTTLNSMVLYLIYILDHPFMGHTSIPSDPFNTVLRTFVRGIVNQ